MEDIKIQTKTTPLPLEVTSKLKIFGIVSLKKELVSAIPEKDMWLAIIGAYEYPTAEYAAREGLKILGLNPDNFKIGHIVVSRNVEDIVQPAMPQVAEMPGVDSVTKPIKSKTELAAYVHYVFEKVGTLEEKEMAQKVIERFKKHE